nr:DUF624 domain-containing protein [uncultured Blautia sp.]
MGRFFNMDNKFFVFMGKVADLCLLNLVCILCCIPVVTAGASLTALYYVTMKMVRNEEAYIFRSFFKSFKQNFRQATVINLIMLAAALVLYLDTKIVGGMGNSFGKILGIIFAMFTMVYLIIFLYLYPILAKFYNSIKNTFKNAILMGIRHLPYTFLMLVISACPLLIFLIPSFQVSSILLMLFVLMGPAAIAYCNSLFFVRIFDKYIPTEEQSDAYISAEEKIQ